MTLDNLFMTDNTAKPIGIGQPIGTLSSGSSFVGTAVDMVAAKLSERHFQKSHVWRDALRHALPGHWCEQQDYVGCSVQLKIMSGQFLIGSYYYNWDLPRLQHTFVEDTLDIITLCEEGLPSKRLEALLSNYETLELPVDEFIVIANVFSEKKQAERVREVQMLQEQLQVNSFNSTAYIGPSGIGIGPKNPAHVPEDQLRQYYGYDYGHAKPLTGGSK